MRKLTLTLCFLLMASSAHALVTDWPHNETNDIGCTDCHSYSLWWQFSPVDGDPVVRAEKTNSICTGCHTGNAGEEIFAQAHSSEGMGAFHNVDLGDWARACTDCHDPHFQAQLNWYGDASVANEDLFVVTGKVSNIIDNGDNTTSFDYANTDVGSNIYWDDNVTMWPSKSGTDNRGLLVTLPITDPAGIDPATLEIIDATGDASAGTIMVSGAIDPADDNATFGLLYGQLIRDSIEGPAGAQDVKFFDPYGGFVDDVNNEGLCQVCHSNANHFLYDGTMDAPWGGGDNETDHVDDHQGKSGDMGNSGKDSRCTYCHTHNRGFAPAGDGGQHPLHLAMEGIDCDFCHTDGTPDPLTEVGCNICHNDGKGIDNTLTGDEGVHYIVDAVSNRYGLPNDMDYRAEWENLDPAYSLNCNSCHNGRLNLEDVVDTNYTHLPGDSACDTCHDGTVEAEVVVGMQGVDDGHTRLASSKWIRQYDCFFCHVDTVSESYTLLSKHANQQLNVDIESPQWAVTGQTDPYYTYDNPQGEETAKTCYNVYCHTDGTTLTPEMRPYPWDGGHQDCNACHGHAQAQDCESCHGDGRSWADYPDLKWLSAMPMYTNTGPGTDKANSHYRHLFTGFSCDDCHMDTIAGGSCLNCHETTIPTGSMNENQHINPQYHVNRSKNVVFKDGGTYNPTNKSCDNTACHTGYEPEWGGSVYDSIVCRKCHGVTDEDVDDFGKFNDTRAKINLNQWTSNGHGRQGYVADNGTSDNPYPSGNPPANFPDNGCWYCHDSKVLHQNEERPFRLIQHDHFENRFEKECVFCHMVALPGDNSECIACHNSTQSLAPQLDNVPSSHAQTGDMTVCSDCHNETMDPPSTVDHVTCSTSVCHTVVPEIWSSPDHRDFNSQGFVGAPGNSSCDSAGCHVDDASRHDTGALIWTQEDKDDVKNAYLQMGVCLKCHDDDSGDQCSSCHTGSQYDLGFDPADFDDSLAGKTAGKIVPKKAKASSFHFGYKHFNAFAESSSVEAEPLYAGIVSDNSTLERILIGSSTAGWIEDQFSGRRVTITSGVNSGLTRPIVRNTATIITVAPPFPDGQFLMEDDTFEILDHVWKGGKFCWDCHDPHGDDNIYMIQNEVATRTDGVVGKPIDRKKVSFIRKTTGTDYVDLVADQETGEFNGICNVCHTDSEMHYTATSGNGHNSSRVCTECHEHRFTNSHASGESCNSCHRSRPVPRHTAFGQARDCTKCHKDAINARMNIMAQFSANSRHVQGVKVTNKHCYACHWEATPEGVIDLDKHKGYNYKTHVAEKDSEVDLVIWGAGIRPADYDADGLGDNDTAVTFLATEINVWDDNETLRSTLPRQRAQVDNVTKHCLGCHSDQNNDTQPFNIADPDNGDCKTPRQYAWDRSSIAARYSDNSTTVLGKYAGPNVADKTVTKAFSAHGNANKGEGGWDATDGVDGDITGSRPGDYNIQCFDCHSSHGSMVEGITSSYTTFNGTKNGANLKETQAGKGGYTMTYKATANPNPNTVNPYQAGAGQCFDCHETANSNTQVSVSSTVPWGYSDTFEAGQPIIGYRDNPRFSGDYSGAKFPYRDGKATLGGHFRATHSNPAAPSGFYDPTTDPGHASYISSKDPNQPDYDPATSLVGAMGTIDGLCSPCHDPHGVSRSMGAYREYAVPLLKGTWMSSPYKEDGAPLDNDGQGGNNYFYNNRNNWNTSSSYPRPYPQKADGEDVSGVWRTDRNTFNNTDLSQKTSRPDDYGRVNEDAELFAGLCLRCHPKETLTVEIDPGDNTTQTENIEWATSDRVHRAVKGWGWSDGDTPREHSFTCSKCHQPHASGLPRLMQTNCLNYAHRGQQVSGGSPIPTRAESHAEFEGKFPYGWWDNGVFLQDSTGICHGADTANGSAGWPDNQKWNDVTPWEGQ